jgi:hypothetical protein
MTFPRLVIALAALFFFALGLDWWYSGSHPMWGMALDVVSFVVGAAATARRSRASS